MPRPRKRRRIQRSTRSVIYKPAGVPLDGLRRVILLPEELEALRLADLEGLTQAEAAQRMGISRSSFQRTVAAAHRQVALALTEGCALVIEGRTVDLAPAHPRRGQQQDRG